MTMTMNDNHTEPSAPLDLRTKAREVGNCTDRAPGSKGRSCDTDKAGLECSSRGSTSPTIKTDNEEYKDSRVQATMHSILKGSKEADGNVKSSETSASKLPLRKRPFPPNSKPVGQSGSHVEELQSKTDSRISPKVLKRDSLQNRSNVETRGQLMQTPVPAGSHGSNDGQLRQTVPPCYTYVVSRPYTNISTHLPLDANCLLNCIAMATRPDEDGDTPLHIAVVQEKVPFVHWLIQIFHRAHKDLDLYNNLRQTPLHLAVITHQPELVATLLQGGADPGALDRHGQTTLHLCCEHNQRDCLSVTLCHLSRAPHVYSDLLNSRNYEGLTPLHLAVKDRNKKLAKMLLDSGADINAVDIKSGCSPLVHAVEINCMDMVNFLIENGCNVNAQSYSGNTALHIACGRGEVEAVRILLKNGADCSLKNFHNDTAVMVAKNKKVSDVLRGKVPRGHILKTEQCLNDSPPPSKLSCSPTTTPVPQCSASLSPVAVPTHSPHSQSAESISGNLSPVDTQEQEDLQMRPQTFHDMLPNRMDCRMSFHSFHTLASLYDTFFPPHINVEAFMPSQSCYYPPDVQRVLYPHEAPLIIFPGSHGRAAPPGRSSPPSQSNATQSRPSSHSSEQSDISNTSVSSEGKGVS